MKLIVDATGISCWAVRCFNIPYVLLQNLSKFRLSDHMLLFHMESESNSRAAHGTFSPAGNAL